MEGQATYRRIAVKIGSNVLTRSDGTLNVTRMSAIVDQVATLRHMGVEVILVSSGAVAAGRSMMRRRGVAPLDAVSERMLFSAVGQVRLINRYYDFFSDRSLTCGQVLTMKECFSTRHHYLNQRHCMNTMLAHGVIPIVNENDTISVTELMFTDNDELSGLIATMMECQALVILSNIDGVYDGNPDLPQSKVITDIAHTDVPNAASFIQKKKSSFGRGGMSTKFHIAQKVANEGCEVIIANGNREGILLDVVRGNRKVPYTLFHAAPQPVSSLKKWIAHSEGFAKGEIHVNEGASQALTGETASSVLPAGVTRIMGEFEKDDIVRIVAPDGTTIGYGRAAYSAAKARTVMGCKAKRPLVHYDYLYVE